MSRTSALIILLVTSFTQSTDTAIVTTLDRLYSDALQNYTSKTLPLINASDTVNIAMTAYVININNFDELSGELSITMSFIMSWTEKRISWNIADYDDIAFFSVSPEDIWRPKIFLLQASDKVADIGNTSIEPILYYDGDVSWVTSQVVRVSCSVDVTYFPFDTQECQMSLLNWATSLSSMTITAANSTVREDYFNENSQWVLKPSSLHACTGRQAGAPCISLEIVLKRRSSFFVLYILIPLIFLGLINNLVFVMPPSSGERNSVAITTFLSFIVYMDIVNEVVPQSSEPIAHVYFYIACLLIYSCTIMFLCIISLRIYNSKKVVPDYVQKIVWILKFECLRNRSSSVGDIPLQEKNNSDGILNETDGVFDKKPDAQLDTDANYKQAFKFQNKTTFGRPKYTWKTVGKVFDFYCCSFLYLLLAIASIVMFALWENA